MSAPQHDPHLSAELMQAFLDGEAPGRESARVREHTRSCARCRSELEAWEALFTELGGLEEVAPAPDFGERVLVHVPALASRRRSLRVRALEKMGVRSPSPALRPGHVTGERIQDLLEGLLPREEALGVEAHLHACRGCRQDVEGWRALLGTLEELPELAPSEAFSERVMAHVRVQLAVATARPTVKERLQLLSRMVSPRTRKRVAALAGAAVTPAVTLALVAYTVFSHPLVTLGNLVSFLWLKGSDLLATSGAGLLEPFAEGAAALQASPAFGVVAASPAAMAVAATGLSALTGAAAWVFYRNVLSAQPVDGRHGR